MAIEQLAEINLSWSAAGTVPASASAAYADWLAALGATETLSSLNGNYNRVMLNAAPFMAGASSRVVWSQNGGLGCFYYPPANETQTIHTLTPSASNYLTATLPDLTLIFQEGGTTGLATANSRVAVSGSTALIFARVHSIGNVNSNAIEVALRITPGSIDLVVTNISAPTPVIRTYLKYGYTFLTGQTVVSGFSGTVAYVLTQTATLRQTEGRTLATVEPAILPAAPPPTRPPMVALTPMNGVDVLPKGLPIGGKDASTGSALLSMADFKGPGRITGTVKERDVAGDIPVHRLVRLLRDRDGVTVRSTWSDPVTGAYSFDGVPMDYRYTAISYDFLKNFRAVIADNLTPEAMP
jgi:hypothetical protein